MKLVPFFIQKKETSLLTIYRLTLFLTDGGKSLWEIGQETNEQTIMNEYLQENGFIPLKVERWNDMYLAKLDPLQTNKSSFYTWEETQESSEKRREDCFRTFVFCFEKHDEKLWFHSEVCHQSFDGNGETPYTLFRGLKSLYYKEIE